MTKSRSFRIHLASQNEAQLIASARDSTPVKGLTHGFYKYPARFSPQFVRAAIETFTRKGDLVLDPHVGGTAYLERMMQRDLIDRIRKSALVCAGIKTSPTSANKPDIVPWFVLTDDPDIDWAKSKVCAFGQNFAAVRVLSRASHAPADEHQQKEKKKLGRPSVDAALTIVVTQLRCERALSGLSRKEQIELVRKRARNLFPNLFPKATQPSRPKILQALNDPESAAQLQPPSTLSQKST
jgi:hypothetical protein